MGKKTVRTAVGRAKGKGIGHRHMKKDPWSDITGIFVMFADGTIMFAVGDAAGKFLTWVCLRELEAVAHGGDPLPVRDFFTLSDPPTKEELDRIRESSACTTI